MAEEDTTRARVVKYLNSNYWPQGLQKHLLKSVSTVPWRFFVCDNSGSMGKSDGKRVVGVGRNVALATDSRWTEMTDSMMYNTELAEILQARCEFRLLNGDDERSDPIVVGDLNVRLDVQKDALVKLKNLFNQTPKKGSTPLCNTVKEVIEVIQQNENDLNDANQRVCIVISTDGKPTDGELADVMKPLKKLPVFVVIKLCTSNKDVVKYWNRIDEILDHTLDVLDDIENETEKIYKVNPWLNYNESLHRMREFGVQIKWLDKLNEKPFDTIQLHEFIMQLFDIELDTLPDPQTEFKEFLEVIKKLNHQNPFLYNFHHKKMMLLIDIETLKECYKNEVDYQADIN